MATRSVLRELVEAAADAGLGRVEIESDGGVVAAQRVADGEAFDLVFLAEKALRTLGADGRVLADSVRPLLLSQVAAAVPSGTSEAAAYDGGEAFDGPAGMIAALRAAERVGYSTGPSGTALVRMIGDWGLDEELGSKLEQARPGVPVARALAEGEVDLGFQQLSELVGQPGVRILGLLPPESAITTVFAGAVASATDDAGAAMRVLAFLSSEAVRPIVERHHFSPAHV
jgi:molybdate transport system substrate-binding protein